MSIPWDKVWGWLTKHLSRHQIVALAMVLVAAWSAYFGWTVGAFLQQFLWESWVFGVILPIALVVGAIVIWFKFPLLHRCVVIGIAVPLLALGCAGKVWAQDDAPVFFDQYEANLYCNPLRLALGSVVFQAPAAPASPTKDVELQQIELQESTQEKAGFSTDVAAKKTSLDQACAQVVSGTMTIDAFFKTFDDVSSFVASHQPQGGSGDLANTFVGYNGNPNATEGQYLPGGGAASLAQMAKSVALAATNGAARPTKVVPPTLMLYVTMVITDVPTYSEAQKSVPNDTSNLYVAIQQLGNRMGPDRAAIWLGTIGHPTLPDLQHGYAILAALRPLAPHFNFDSASGPYLAITHGPPDHATDLLPINLANVLAKDRLTLLSKLGDRLSVEKRPLLSRTRSRSFFDLVFKNTKALLVSLGIPVP